MGVNRHRPHVVVIPEDDANRQLANGFYLGVPSPPIRIEPPARGWMNVLSIFLESHVGAMKRFQGQHTVLLLDFDQDPDRRKNLLDRVPPALADRVFILGSWSEPENLRGDLGMSFERIGTDLARDCRKGDGTIWNHPLLEHNQNEIIRLRKVCAFLFASE